MDILIQDVSNKYVLFYIMDMCVCSYGLWLICMIDQLMVIILLQSYGIIVVLTPEIAFSKFLIFFLNRLKSPLIALKRIT